MPTATENVSLSPHPTAASDIVHHIDARIQWVATKRLAIRYMMEGNCARLLIPSGRMPRRAGGLWRHTCFEIFLLKPDGEGYFEYNFSPSGEWAVYDFAAYRQPAPPLEIIAPEIVVAHRKSGFDVDAAIALPTALHTSLPLKIGVAAVIEDDGGRLSYWALSHAPGKPDFHLRDNFKVELSAPRLTAGESSIGK